MSGKTNLSATLFSQKKLLGKTSTGTHRADSNEPIPSGLQVATATVFSEDVPSSPSRTLFTMQAPDGGLPKTVEYVEFTLQAVTGSTYDANDFDTESTSQASGPHAYRLVLSESYQPNSDNPNKGVYPYIDNQILHWTLGSLQLVSPGFSNDVPNPYTLKLYESDGTEIPLLDEIDWQVDYFSGMLFVQDYDSTKIPSSAKGFIYTGKMLSQSLGEAIAGSGGGGGGGDAAGVGWFASGNGSISTSGSVYFGTQNTTNPEIFFSSVGAATFNEQGRNVDFRVETTGDQNTLFVQGSTDRVGIGLSAPGTTLHISDSDPTIRIQREANTENGTLDFAGSSGNVGASIEHEANGNDLVLNVFNGSTVEESLRLGGYSSGENRQVIVLSGSTMHAGAMQPKEASDIAFFVSGSVDSRGTSVKGTSVFGGDVAISGTLAVNLSDAAVGSQFVVTTDGKVGIGTSTPSYKLSVGGNMDVGEYIYHKNDANTYIRFQDDDINVQVGGRSMIKMREEASIDQVLIMSGNSSKNSPNPKNFSDTNFFVSGSIGSRGTSDPGTAVFGGDVVISGTLHGGSPLKVDGGMEITGTFELKPKIGDDAIVRNPHGPVKVFAHTNVKIGAGSGVIDFLDLNDGAAGQIILTGSGPGASRSIELNTPGTLFFTGSAGGAKFKGPIEAENGLSGSLTRLTDGSSFLVAGSNVAISSASNGQIIISSTGGGDGSVDFTGGAGSNNQMITADGSGNIVAESNITFNGNVLNVSGDILPGSDNSYDLGSPTSRFANIYTGDLHLRNERGHWQIVEEADALTVINRLTGKRYKMVLEPYDEEK